MSDDTNEQIGKIYDLVRDIKVDVASLRTIIKLAESVRENHENRIKELEIKEAKRSGFLTAIGLIASAIGAFVSWVATKLFGGN